MQPEDHDFAGWAKAPSPTIQKAANIGALRLAGLENGLFMKLNPGRGAELRGWAALIKYL